MAINIGQELALPMDQIIGGPMQAIVKAQSLAASETASFIQNVGLQTTGTGNSRKSTARMVNFSFERKVAPADGNTSPSTEEVKLNVPC